MWIEYYTLLYLLFIVTVLFRFEGGLMEHSLKLSEGFAAVLELCDLMSTTREPW